MADENLGSINCVAVWRSGCVNEARGWKVLDSMVRFIDMFPTEMRKLLIFVVDIAPELVMEKRGEKHNQCPLSVSLLNSSNAIGQASRYSDPKSMVLWQTDEIA